jgi:hypothetical protein
MLMLVSMLAGAQAASAATTSLTLGDQDFADGAMPSTGAFATAGTGEPAPFDGQFIGSDVSGPNFSASWTFAYAAPVDVVTGGSLTLGIYEHESAASGHQVASFSLNGIDLTPQLDALFESHGGASREDSVYTLTLPASTFAALGTGSVTFALALNGPGLGVLGETPFNGAALDFSTLNVTTQPIPEPDTLALFLLGMPALLLARRRKV